MVGYLAGIDFIVSKPISSIRTPGVLNWIELHVYKRENLMSYTKVRQIYTCKIFKMNPFAFQCINLSGMNLD
jgi:hypothetical protein